MAIVRQRPLSIEETVGALHAARAALEQENWVTLTGQENSHRSSTPMETTADMAKNTTEATSGEVMTSPMLPGVVIRPPSEEARRRALEGIAALRALQEKILARRGGRPFTEEELTAALHEARAAHDRGE